MLNKNIIQVSFICLISTLVIISIYITLIMATINFIS